jgi:hypothetical protein
MGGVGAVALVRPGPVTRGCPPFLVTLTAPARTHAHPFQASLEVSGITGLPTGPVHVGAPPQARPPDPTSAGSERERGRRCTDFRAWTAAAIGKALAGPRCHSRWDSQSERQTPIPAAPAFTSPLPPRAPAGAHLGADVQRHCRLLGSGREPHLPV